MGEGAFRAKLENWQESQTQEEPDLLGSYQNRSLGTGLRGEALLFEGWRQAGVREIGALWLKLGLWGAVINSQSYLMQDPRVELAQVKGLLPQDVIGPENWRWDWADHRWIRWSLLGREKKECSFTGDRCILEVALTGLDRRQCRILSLGGWPYPTYVICKPPNFWTQNTLSLSCV